MMTVEHKRLHTLHYCLQLHLLSQSPRLHWTFSTRPLSCPLNFLFSLPRMCLPFICLASVLYPLSASFLDLINSYSPLNSNSLIHYKVV